MKAPLNTNDNNLISCKIYIKPGKQIRRINLARDTSLGEFKKKLLDLVMNRSQADWSSCLLHICYADEEKDWITVDSEEEWKEALGNHIRQNLPEGNVFRVKVLIQSTNKKCETSLLNNDLQSLFEERIRNPLIEQVKLTGDQVKPYVDQMKEMAYGNAKKIQEWLMDSDKQQELRQWICGTFERITKEGQQVQYKISSWLGELEQKLDSLLFPNESTTASETLIASNNSAIHAERESNEETGEYYNNNSLLEMNDEEKQKEQEQELLMHESDQLYL
jgi:hypothetical protein